MRIRFLTFLFCLFTLTFLSGCQSGFWSSSYHSDGTYLSVHKGDTLYSLARKNNIPMRTLIDENNLKPPYNLYAGQKLRIPQAKTHTVQRGETLYSISKKYHMSVSSLSRLNKLKEPYNISVGQKLAIASEKESASANKKNEPEKGENDYQSTDDTKQTNIQQTPQKEATGTARRSISVPKSQAKKKFAWPLKGQVISSFGTMNKGQCNDGINISAKKGTPIKAADAGTVGYAGNELKGYGNLVIIRHTNGWITAYAHNDKLLVKKGQKIKKGQSIATVGQTGNVKTPQLHFEIRYKTKVVNPKSYLQ